MPTADPSLLHPEISGLPGSREIPDSREFRRFFWDDTHPCVPGSSSLTFRLPESRITAEVEASSITSRRKIAAPLEGRHQPRSPRRFGSRIPCWMSSTRSARQWRASHPERSRWIEVARDLLLVRAIQAPRARPPCDACRGLLPTSRGDSHGIAVRRGATALAPARPKFGRWGCPVRPS